MEDVGLITREAMERAYKLRSTELRARALVDSAVAHALRNIGEPDERDFARYAYEVATNAATMLMHHIYENDAELKALRMERDHYKGLAERALLVSAPPVYIRDSDTRPKDGDAKQGSTRE